jgi:Lar family restriction alleviation protein
MSSVKECPFCGCRDYGIGRGTEDREGWPVFINCATCGAQGPWTYTRDKAAFTCTGHCAELTGWNKRFARRSN